MATGGTTSPTEDVRNRVLPVFMKNNTLPAANSKEYTTAEICEAAEKVCGSGNILGAQRISGLWRVYPATTDARQALLVSGLTLRHYKVTVRDKNPFLITAPSGSGSDQSERERPVTKVVISNVPISFSNVHILEAFTKLSVETRSKLIEERDRDSTGKLTRWLTGRRFIYISVPTSPLPKFVSIGPFKATLFHREQKQQEKTQHAECRRCFEKSHGTAQCPNQIKCRQCFKEGHKAGDPLCDFFPPSSSESVSPSLHPFPSPLLQSKMSSTSLADENFRPPPPPRNFSPVHRGIRSQSRGRSRTRKSPANQQTLPFRRDSSSAKRARSPGDNTASEATSRDKQARMADKADGSDSTASTMIATTIVNSADMPPSCTHST